MSDTCNDIQMLEQLGAGLAEIARDVAGDELAAEVSRAFGANVEAHRESARLAASGDVSADAVIESTRRMDKSVGAVEEALRDLEAAIDQGAVK